MQWVWEQTGADIDSNWGDQSGAVSISADGTTIAIGSRYSDGNGNNSGQVRVFKFNGSIWMPLGQAINGSGLYECFGWVTSLSADGTVVAVGTPFSDGTGQSRGFARVYKLQGTTWIKQGQDIIGVAAGDRCGESVSLSSDGLTVAVGAGFNDGNGTNAGQVRVFKFENSAWVQKGQDIYGQYSYDMFGITSSLSADGTTVAIGAPGNSVARTDAGHVRVYKFIGSTWTKQGQDIYGESSYDNSGTSVSLSADGLTVAIGAINNDGNGADSGQVRVYKLIGSTWTKQGQDIDGEAAGDQSGICVSLSADGLTVAIGALNNDGNGTDSGQVRIYKLEGSTWTKQGEDIDGEAAGDQSGLFTSLSGDGTRVAIGSRLNDGNGDNSGHVRVFSYVPAPPPPPPPPPAPVCFLADAPVLTPTGYRPISAIVVGDLVRTAEGRTVTVKRVFSKEYNPSTSANPYVIPKGSFGALRALPISPNHEVMVPGRGMVKAKNIGLPRMKMTDSFTYYNLELEDWVRDNLVVAGVTCESLAPAKRITMTKEEFGRFVKARYGPSAASRLRSVCFEESDGRVSMPAFR